MADAVAALNLNPIAAEIADQAAHAVELGTSLFVLVVYEHEAEKLELVRQVRTRCAERGLQAPTIDPRELPTQGAGTLYGRIAERGAKAVALVTDVPARAGRPGIDDDFLSYLNVHRDRISREKLRFVLFVHSSDMEQLANAAGDLWDFRHGTYWLERPGGARGPQAWQVVEDGVRALALPEAERSEIAEHVAAVRSHVEATVSHEEKAALLLDLSTWLRSRHTNVQAAEVAREGIDLIPSDRSRLRADLEHAAGYALAKAAHAPEALTHYERSLAIRREVGDRAGEAVTLNNISLVYRDWGRNDEALKTLEQSLAIRREIGDRAGEAVTLSNISQVYHAWGRNDEALKTLEQSLAIRREVGDRGGEAVTLNNISLVYHVWGKYDEALKTLDQSLAIRREIGDRAGEAMTLNNISQVYRAWGRNDEALKTLEQSLAIYRKVENRAGEAVTLNNISQVLDAWGRNDEALETLERSLAIYREVGGRAGEAMTLNNISSVYHAWGRNDEALKTLEQSLAIFREVGDRTGEAATLNNISQVYHAWGRYDEALKTLEQSLAIRREVGDRAGEAVTLNNISQVYRAWSRNDEALKTLEQSLAIQREIGDRAGEAVTSWNLSIEHERRGDLDRAIELARRTVEIDRQTGHPNLEPHSARLRGLESQAAAVSTRPSESAAPAAAGERRRSWFARLRAWLGRLFGSGADSSRPFAA